MGGACWVLGFGGLMLFGGYYWLWVFMVLRDYVVWFGFGGVLVGAGCVVCGLRFMVNLF